MGVFNRQGAVRPDLTLRIDHQVAVTRRGLVRQELGPIADAIRNGAPLVIESAFLGEDLVFQP